MNIESMITSDGQTIPGRVIRYLAAYIREKSTLIVQQETGKQALFECTKDEIQSLFNLVTSYDLESMKD